MLNKTNLAKDLEKLLNDQVPNKDVEKLKDIEKRNKVLAKGIADAVDKYIKQASIDVKKIQMLPGTMCIINPGQPVVAWGSGASAGPGTGQTSAPASLNPATGINCGKIY
jgi:1,6-anhydro-N-acetylmuramate kinase